jgi:hypothetical protein
MGDEMIGGNTKQYPYSLDRVNIYGEYSNCSGN